MQIDQHIYIFDTTLRDGQQSPGAGMSFEDNVLYAQYASDLGVDILEAGFPAASQRDYEIVNTISRKMTEQRSSMIIAALCQLREEQVVSTMEALQPSLFFSKARVHTYVPIDPNLMKASLGKKVSDYKHIPKDVYRFVKMATDSGFEVEFSLEGYSRLQNNFNFASDLIYAAVSAGANIINCPDTIGGASRWDDENYFVHCMRRHADMIDALFPEKKIVWSVHCHNDLGLALDNTLTAVFNGPATQIEGCINGIGERAGNVALEQCIMMIDQVGEICDDKKRYYTHAKLDKLKIISDFVAEKMLSRQPHWPVVGENAARHSSGGHTNAIIKNPSSYQPFDPAKVGKQIEFIFGPLSGSNHAKKIIERNAQVCADHEKTKIMQFIKNYYVDRRKGITDDELMKAYFAYREIKKVKNA